MQEGLSVKLPPVLSILLQVLPETGTGSISCRKYHEGPPRFDHPTSFRFRSKPLGQLCKPSSRYLHQMCYWSIWFPHAVAWQKASGDICTRGLNIALGLGLEMQNSLSDPNWKPLWHINKVCCSHRLQLWIYKVSDQINWAAVGVFNYTGFWLITLCRTMSARFLMPKTLPEVCGAARPLL